MASGEVNWSLCCLCQTNDDGEMRCPAQSKRKDRSAGYESLSHALSQFENGNNLPIYIPEFITKNANLQDTLMVNQVKFHEACMNKLTRLNRKEKRPYNAVDEPAHTSPVKTRRCTPNDDRVSICLFCGTNDSEHLMHSVTSTGCDVTVRAWATNLKDFDMLGKLSSGDLFAQDAVYHKECMTKYYTRHRARLRQRHSKGKVSQFELEGIAFAETVAYVIEDDSDGPFYVTELTDLYAARLKDLGGTRENTHNSFPKAYFVRNTMD